MTIRPKVKDRYYVALFIILGTLVANTICVTNWHDILDGWATLPYPYDDLLFGTTVSTFIGMMWYIRRRLVEQRSMAKELARVVTESKQAKGEVETLNKQMEFILGVTKTGLDIIDSDFNIRYIDSEWEKVYGDPTGRKCHEYFMDSSEVCHGCGIMSSKETKSPTVTEEVLVKEGNRPIQVTTIPFQNDKGEWLFAEVNVDISERKKTEKLLNKINKELSITNKKLEKMSVTDSLTKLYNLRYFYKRLEEIIAESNRSKSVFSILMLDLDDFKKVNDTKGHVAGNGVLSQVGKSIRTLLRKYDVGARMGGDEFSIILPNTGWEDANNVGLRIIDKLADTVEVSIGVSMYHFDEDIVSFIKRADTEMYNVKNVRKLAKSCRLDVVE